MKFEEQPPINPSQEKILSAREETPPVKIEGEQRIELDPVMEEITKQIRIENETIGPGINVRFAEKTPKGVKKALQALLVAGTLFFGMGAFNKAEAGDSTWHKFWKQAERNMLVGMEGNLQRSEEAADMGQRMGLELARQRAQMEISREQIAASMAISGEFQTQQRQENKRFQKEEEKARAIQEEVRRYAQAIARNGADLNHEEKIHNDIMNEIKKNY